MGCVLSRQASQAGRGRAAGELTVSPTRIPEATVARLPVYLRALNSLLEGEIRTCSSEELATAAGVNSAKLRKDLSHLGSYGTRGVGYDVEYLRYQIAREIGLTQDWPVVIVGIGNLGHALANYSGFTSRGFRTVALLDADGARQGELVAGLKIRPLTELSAIVRQHVVAIGVSASAASLSGESRPGPPRRRRSAPTGPGPASAASTTPGPPRSPCQSGTPSG